MEKDLVFSFYRENILLCDKYSDLSCKYYFNTEDKKADYANCPKNGESIEEFLKERVFPETRVNCKEVLKSLGLPFYDVEMICKRTNGIMCDDKYWIKFINSNINSYEEALKSVS